MYTQPITYQPSFNGKIYCMNCIGIKDGFIKLPQKATKNRVLDLPSKTWDRLNRMIEEKPYDIFIHPNANNEEFFNVDAGKSFKNVLEGIQGRVKVRYNALEALPLAIEDAVKNFEEHLDGLKIKQYSKKESV